VTNPLKNICEKLTHTHKVLYTWWCWHICKGEVVGVELDQLREEKRFFGVIKTIGWSLDWNSILIHCALDQICK
jgi:hypothetical protein